jgi:hypothetical protein
MAGCYEHNNELSDCIRGSWLAQQLLAFTKEHYSAKQGKIHHERSTFLPPPQVKCDACLFVCSSWMLIKRILHVVISVY